jgi:hypothetical protein
MIVGRMAREIVARSHEKGGVFKADSLGTKGQRFWGDAVSKKPTQRGNSRSYLITKGCEVKMSSFGPQPVVSELGISLCNLCTPRLHEKKLD